MTRQVLRAAKVRMHANEQSLQDEYKKKYFEAFELIKRLLNEKVTSFTLSINTNNLASYMAGMHLSTVLIMYCLSDSICASHQID